MIKLIWFINNKITNNNNASIWIKNTDNLEIDNKNYIKILDEYTSLIYNFFYIPTKSLDLQWVDLIYKSPILNKEIYIDIKTQTNINNKITLYLREFNKSKIQNRNFIIFNKEANNLKWKIFFINSKLIENLINNELFNNFLKQTEHFWELTQNIIEQIPQKNEEFKKYKNQYNNKIIKITNINIQIRFLETKRKDKKGNIWNTNFKENIKIDFFI